MINFNTCSVHINKTKNKKPAFKSKPLYDVKIYDGQKLIPAKFTQLNAKDEDDVKAISEIKKNWKHATLKDFITSYFLNFANSEKKDPYDYYSIELLEPNLSPSEKTKGLARCLKTESSEIDLIQVSYDANEANKNRRYQHVGEMLLYGIIKKAKDEKLSCVKLNSVKKNYPFYNKFGFDYRNPYSSNEMILKKEDFVDNLNSIERKHRLNHTA